MLGRALRCTDIRFKFFGLKIGWAGVCVFYFWSKFLYVVFEFPNFEVK